MVLAGPCHRAALPAGITKEERLTDIAGGLAGPLVQAAPSLDPGHGAAHKEAVLHVHLQQQASAGEPLALLSAQGACLEHDIS